MRQQNGHKVVIINMSNLPPLLSDQIAESGGTLRRPRLDDAIGSALTAAYGYADKLPDDMMAALQKLDAVQFSQSRS